MVTPGIQDPPRRFLPTLVRLGPGMVLAGSIVGSGELIATTTTGARAGFTLLWLIVGGCVIKVFAQVELGRAAVGRGRTALDVLSELPGPRLRAGWGVWAWVAMTLLTLGQLGGIVGAIGSTLALSVPITAAGAEREALEDDLIRLEIEAATGKGVAGVTAEIERAREALLTIPTAHDALLWATAATLLTSLLLGIGRYRLIQSVATVTVAGFTVLTLMTLYLLQRDPEWAIRGSELASGFSFSLPEAASMGDTRPVATALATFGMIGVGAAELVFYPYWCIEKGYARWTGEQEASTQWTERARGWLRVMRIDAWVSAVVYTFATIAFFLLGAAVLGRVGLDPGKGDLVRTLGAMYEPVFGTWARPVFLAGAFCVLYSTFFVAMASIARVATDALLHLRLIAADEATRLFWVRLFSIGLPLASYVVYCFVRAPLGLVLAGGVAQALMLPILGVAALQQRFAFAPRGLRPGRIWDAALLLSSTGLVLAGSWTLWNLLS